MVMKINVPTEPCLDKTETNSQTEVSTVLLLTYTRSDRQTGSLLTRRRHSSQRVQQCKCSRALILVPIFIRNV